MGSRIRCRRMSLRSVRPRVEVRVRNQRLSGPNPQSDRITRMAISRRRTADSRETNIRHLHVCQTIRSPGAIPSLKDRPYKRQVAIRIRPFRV